MRKKLTFEFTVTEKSAEQFSEEMKFLQQLPEEYFDKIIQFDESEIEKNNGLDLAFIDALASCIALKTVLTETEKRKQTKLN